MGCINAFATMVLVRIVLCKRCTYACAIHCSIFKHTGFESVPASEYHRTIHLTNPSFIDAFAMAKVNMAVQDVPV